MARHHRKHHHARRRNPFVERGELALVGWAVIGAVATEVIPAKVVPNMSSGMPGYVAKIVTAFVLKFAGKYVSQNAGSGMFIGGLVTTGVDIVKDYLGASLGLSAYWGSPFALPTNSNPWGVVTKNPYAALNPPPAVTAAGTMGRAAFVSRRSRY